MSKFPSKYMVWQAMDAFGNVSKPYISNGTMNQHVYLEECLRKRLLPFILAHHDIDDILFWPDLASCHYANIVKEYLNQKNVTFVQKQHNPPNVPQARGIEMFWAICKQRYHAHPGGAKSLHGFKLIWNRISKDAAREVGKSCMDHAWRKLISIGYKGIRGNHV